MSQEFVMLLAEINAADLNVLTELMTGGKVKPVIDRTYPTSNVPDAIRYLGHARGKVVVDVAEAQ
jgi:NADPH:quinone reductase-like Zn-dependent oxidoreductase